MRTAVKLFALAGVGSLSLLISVVAGGQAPWYFAWMLGTMMIILISVAGGILFDTQFALEKEALNKAERSKK